MIVEQSSFGSLSHWAGVAALSLVAAALYPLATKKLRFFVTKWWVEQRTRHNLGVEVKPGEAPNHLSADPVPANFRRA